MDLYNTFSSPSLYLHVKNKNVTGNHEVSPMSLLEVRPSARNGTPAQVTHPDVSRDRVTTRVTSLEIV